MVMIFLILMVLFFITLFIKDSPCKLGAFIGFIVFIIYYIKRVGIDGCNAGKKVFHPKKMNKFSGFYDFIYIYVIF